MFSIQRTVEVVLLSDEADAEWHEALVKHLTVSLENERIALWDTKQIMAGSEPAAIVREHLRQAPVIILLISVELLNSYKQEVEQALERGAADEAQVVPIKLRSVHLSSGPLSLLQFLPKNGQAITQWSDKEDAFADVVGDIQAVVTKARKRLMRDTPQFALEIAEAYLKATGVSPEAYQQSYERQEEARLKEREEAVLKGQQVRLRDCPEPLVIVWSLSFAHVQEHNLVAADLLRLWAYLSTDALPQTIFVKGVSALGCLPGWIMNDRLSLNREIEILLNYVLIEYNSRDKTLCVTLNMQRLLCSEMDEESQKRWIERTILVVQAMLPAVGDTEWSQWKQIMPHARRCAHYIEEYRNQDPESYLPRSVEILHQMGWYLFKQTDFEEAETLLEQAYDMSEKEQADIIDEEEKKPQQLRTARVARTRGHLYREQEKYEQAEAFYKQVRSINERYLGSNHLDTATSLVDLADLYSDQGQYEQAEPLYLQVSAVRQQQLGSEHELTHDITQKLEELRGRLQQPEKGSNRRVFMIGLMSTAAVVTLGSVGYIAVPNILRPPPQITVKFVYSTEKQEWINLVIDAFNVLRVKTNGSNKVIRVEPTLAEGSVRTVNRIAAAARDQNDPNALTPTAWSPASTLEVNLLKSQWKAALPIIYESGELRPKSLVSSPLVFAVFPDRLTKLFNGHAIDWDSLSDLTDKNMVRFGHTRPDESNSGLLTITLLAYAYSHGWNRLKAEQLIGNKDFKDFLDRLEGGITKFGHSSGTFFYECVIENWFDVITTYENLVLADPGQRFQMFYPNPNLLSDHPFTVLQAPWITPEDQEAAQIFRDFLLLPEQQQHALHYGFRPTTESENAKVHITDNVPGNIFLFIAFSGWEIFEGAGSLPRSGDIADTCPNNRRTGVGTEASPCSKQPCRSGRTL